MSCEKKGLWEKTKEVSSEAWNKTKETAENMKENLTKHQAKEKEDKKSSAYHEHNYKK